MAKRYDPILCMMVDEPTKAQDELSLAQKKQVVTELKGYLKKSYNFSDESEYERAYEDLRHMFTTGSRKSISGLFENTVKKTGAHDAKKEDGFKILSAIIRGEKLVLTFEDLLNSPGKKETMEFTKKEAEAFKKDPWNTWTGNTKSVVEKFIGGKVHDAKAKDESYIVRGRKYKVIKRDGDNVTVLGPDGKVTKMDIDFLMSEGKKVSDSASALDEAVKTVDGMFASTFGEYTKGAKFKKEKFLKELAGISDAEELAKRIQTLDNELKNNLERLDEAYNVASKDYYAARNEIRSIMDAFSKEAFSLYRKLGIK